MNQSANLNLEAMRNIDIRTVDIESLREIREIKIDPEKTHAERIADYIKQIKNPYCFRYGNMAVKISHADTEISMEECMAGFFRGL